MINSNDMKICTQLLIAFALCSLKAVAQDKERITVKAGSDVKEVMATKIYQYPEFVQGLVMYKDGNASAGTMNYNRLSAKIEFLTPQGDTLVLDDEKTIRWVALKEQDTFFFDKLYLQLLKPGSTLKLAKNERFRVADQQKIGAYGQPSSTSSISAYNSVSDGMKRVYLDVMRDVILVRHVTYYIGDRFNNYLPANKKNLLKLIPEKETAIKKYFAETKVEFNNKEDLEKLLDYLSS
jgi:hypothetical protein